LRGRERLREREVRGKIYPCMDTSSQWHISSNRAPSTKHPQPPNNVIGLWIYQWINALMKSYPSWSSPQEFCLWTLLALGTKPSTHEPSWDNSYLNHNTFPLAPKGSCLFHSVNVFSPSLWVPKYPWFQHFSKTQAQSLLWDSRQTLSSEPL
jgi:hypothetical protein